MHLMYEKSPLLIYYVPTVQAEEVVPTAGTPSAGLHAMRGPFKLLIQTNYSFCYK